MSRLMISSDLHLGHRNACKWRPFDTPEQHDGVIFENLASNINKADSLLLLGDVAFDKESLHKIGSINCIKKVLILGNHDTEKDRLNIKDFALVFDEIHGMYSKHNVWFTHCPIHPQEMRRRHLNVHGHSHGGVITKTNSMDVDAEYFNVCLEHTNYKPISFQEIKERTFG